MAQIEVKEMAKTGETAAHLGGGVEVPVVAWLAIAAVAAPGGRVVVMWLL